MKEHFVYVEHLCSSKAPTPLSHPYACCGPILAGQPVCAGPQSQAVDKKEKEKGKNYKSHWLSSLTEGRPDSEKRKCRCAMDAIRGSVVVVYYVDAIMMSSADRLLCLRCSFFPVLGAPVGE